MSFFETLNWSYSDKNVLFAQVRNCTGKWSTKLKPITDLRTRLLDLQSYRCAYCQAPIIYDVVGHREIDHILPKDSSNPCCPVKSISNNDDDRYHTQGYPEFKFEPRNLVLICKYCNSSKGSYDSLIKRGATRPLTHYPRSNQVAWFNPHFQNYSDHIAIDQNFIYSHMTDQGKFVLEKCGLMKVELLEKKFGTFALYKASQGGDLYLCITRLAEGISMKEFSINHATNALVNKRRLNAVEARSILDQFMRDGSPRGRKLIEKTCSAIEARLQPASQRLSPARTSKAMK